MILLFGIFQRKSWVGKNQINYIKGLISLQDSTNFLWKCFCYCEICNIPAWMQTQFPLWQFSSDLLGCGLERTNPWYQKMYFLSLKQMNSFSWKAGTWICFNSFPFKTNDLGEGKYSCSQTSCKPFAIPLHSCECGETTLQSPVFFHSRVPLGQMLVASKYFGLMNFCDPISLAGEKFHAFTNQEKESDTCKSSAINSTTDEFSGKLFVRCWLSVNHGTNSRLLAGCFAQTH